MQRKMSLSTLRSYDLIVQPAMGWGNLQYKETVPLEARPAGNEDEFERGLLVELEQELTDDAKADHVTRRYSVPVLEEWAACAGVDASELRVMLQREYVLLAVLLRRVSAVLQQGTWSTDDALRSLSQRERIQVRAPRFAHTLVQSSCRCEHAG